MTALRRTLEDNPVLRADTRYLVKRWWGWVPVLVLGWAPAQAFSRYVGLGAPGMGGSLEAALAAQVLRLMFRPDVLLAFVLAYMASRSPHWLDAREELAVTHLTPGRVAAGKAAAPIALLAVLHALGCVFYYKDLVLDPDYLLRVTRPFPFDVPVGLPIMAFAFVEDLLYATIVVLVGLRAFLFSRHALLGAMRGVGVVMLVGLGIAAGSLAFDLLLVVLPFRTVLTLLDSPARTALVANGIFFGIVLPFEAFVAWRLGRLLVRDTDRWLHASDND